MADIENEMNSLEGRSAKKTQKSRVSQLQGELKRMDTMPVKETRLSSNHPGTASHHGPISVSSKSHNQTSVGRRKTRRDREQQQVL